MVRNGGASIAVHSNGLFCLSDILQELRVGDLIDCALIIQKDVVLVDNAFHFLLPAAQKCCHLGPDPCHLLEW